MSQKTTNIPTTSKNLVQWWPWGEAALKAAQDNNKPILLFINHWTSPKNPTIKDQFKQTPIAAQMNDTFICIKLNQDDRPDIAAIYQAVLPQLGQKAAWPLMLFLTPEAKPYWGHSPLSTEPSQPSLCQILTFAEKCYKEDNEAVTHNAAALTELIAPQKPKIKGPDISDDMLRNLAQRLGDMIDNKNGGLRGTPKFPQFPLFHCLWRLGERFTINTAKQQVEHFLTNLFQGGIYDHVSGGLAHAAKDEHWRIPLHVEKTLYDNALMLELATLVYQETKAPLFKHRCEEIIEWAVRDMHKKNRTFAARIRPYERDKISNFWQAETIKEILAENYELYVQTYNIKVEENKQTEIYPHRSLETPPPADTEEKTLKSCNAKLHEARKKHSPSKRDDKTLTDANAMMIVSLTKASTTFKRPEWQQLAEATFQALEQIMMQETTQSHCLSPKEHPTPALINDYAQIIKASLALYSITTNKHYLNQAENWTKQLNDDFWCNEVGGYFTSSKRRTDVLIRGKTGADDTCPNANGIMVSNLMQLYNLTGDDAYQQQAKNIISAFGAAMAKNIFSHLTLFNSAMDILNQKPTQQ